MTRGDTATPSAPDEERGLYGKYHVTRWNPELKTYEHVDDCFILRPDRDSAAVSALWAYALATTNVALAYDIGVWLASIEQGNPSLEAAAARAQGYREAIAEILAND